MFSNESRVTKDCSPYLKGRNRSLPPNFAHTFVINPHLVTSDCFH